VKPAEPVHSNFFRFLTSGVRSLGVFAYREIPDDPLRRRSIGKEGRACLPMTIQKLILAKEISARRCAFRGSFEKRSSEKQIPLSKACTAASPERNNTLDDA
jgi:hypothetical protein